MPRGTVLVAYSRASFPPLPAVVVAVAAGGVGACLGGLPYSTGGTDPGGSEGVSVAASHLLDWTLQLLLLVRY